jgi:hypothetical protein
MLSSPRRMSRDRRSERHKRYQIRLAGILKKCGYQSVATEKGLPYYLSLHNGQVLKIRYRLDVYGRKGTRKIGAEIDGYMGHRSQRAIEMDGLRTRRLKEAYELENIYRFTFKQLAQWTDKEIAEEMRL